MSNRTGARQRIDNNLLELAAGVKVGATAMGGGADLSSYATVAHSNNYSLMTLNRTVLTYLYTGNGLFQTAIHLPVQDALSRGVELESDELDNTDIDAVLDYWEEHGLWSVVEYACVWARLYGGGGVVVNTGQDPAEKFQLKGLDRQPLEFYDVDRWQLDSSAIYGEDMLPGYTAQGAPREHFMLGGERIHSSRLLQINGTKAPSFIRRQMRGWGLSEGERMIRDLNNYLKTQNVLYEILDESKLDVYHIKNLANKLLTTGGTNKMINRVKAANEIKSFVNALVLDAEEEFEQKQITFGGLAEVMQENRIGVAAALQMPLTKLFGLSASGFNTGESDLENYNEKVESEVRARLRPVVRNMMRITMAHLFGFEPEFRLRFPSLRVLSAEQEQAVKSSELERALLLYDRGLLDSREVGELLAKAGVLELETKAERGLLPPQPTPPAGPEMGVPGGGQREVKVRRA